MTKNIQDLAEVDVVKISGLIPYRDVLGRKDLCMVAEVTFKSGHHTFKVIDCSLHVVNQDGSLVLTRTRREAAALGRQRILEWVEKLPEDPEVLGVVST